MPSIVRSCFIIILKFLKAAIQRHNRGGTDMDIIQWLSSFTSLKITMLLSISFFFLINLFFLRNRFSLTF